MVETLVAAARLGDISDTRWLGMSFEQVLGLLANLALGNDPLADHRRDKIIDAALHDLAFLLLEAFTAAPPVVAEASDNRSRDAVVQFVREVLESHVPSATQLLTLQLSLTLISTLCYSNSASPLVSVKGMSPVFADQPMTVPAPPPRPQHWIWNAFCFTSPRQPTDTNDSGGDDDGRSDDDADDVADDESGDDHSDSSEESYGKAMYGPFLAPRFPKSFAHSYDSYAVCKERGPLFERQHHSRFVPLPLCPV
jgi:hypothetical protein